MIPRISVYLHKTESHSLTRYIELAENHKRNCVSPIKTYHLSNVKKKKKIVLFVVSYCNYSFFIFKICHGHTKYRVIHDIWTVEWASEKVSNLNSLSRACNWSRSYLYGPISRSIFSLLTFPFSLISIIIVILNQTILNFKRQINYAFFLFEGELNYAFSISIMAIN